MSETIGGLAIPIEPDLVRMRSDRHLKLQKQLAAQGLDGLVLLNTSGVAYATGARSPGMDAGRAGLLRSVAVVACGADHPHLFTPYPDGAPPELPADHLHGPLYPDLPDGGSRVAAALAGLFEPGARIALDELPHPMAAGVAGYDVVGSVPVMGPVKLCKTVDELACIRKAQRINELAMAEVLPLMRPGARQVELTARLLQRVFELGATANGIDPIWQVMPLTRAEGPWTTHGGLAFPTGTTDRILRDGDVVWVDSGVLYEGYASDFGRTWLVADDPQPTERQAAQYARWRAIMEAVLAVCKPGAPSLELGQAAIDANDGVRPWIEHFYLAHSVGTDSAEMPMIGTDLGEAFDEQQVLVPGMVLVLEPVIWDEGASGYRSEDIYAVTDDGWVALSDFPYDPFGC